MTNGADGRSVGRVMGRTRDRVGWLAVGASCVVVAGCASAGAASDPAPRQANAPVTAGAASCAALTPAQQRTDSRAIIDAVALPGRADPQGVLLSPARFRVLRYLKGHGPRVVKVPTTVTVPTHGGGYNYAEDAIAPHAGQRWRIDGWRIDAGVLDTSICLGSHRLRAPDRTAAGNRHTAQRDAARLLDRAVLPAGAVRLTAKPRGDGGLLARPPQGVSGLLIDRHRWWRSNDALGSMIAFLKAHPSSGWRLDGSGRQGGPGVPPNQSLSFTLSPIRGAVSKRALLFDVVALHDGGTAIRADAQEVWLLPRPATETIPRGVRVLDVTSARPGRPPVLSRTVTAPATVGRIVAWVDGLEITQPGATACPSLPTRSPVVTFDFRGRPHGPLLAQAAMTDDGGTSTPCDPVSFSIRGHRQRPLLGGDLLRRTQRLLGVRFR